MGIVLSNDQYRRLVELVFAGGWILNSWREPGEVLKEYEDAVQTLFSFYTQFDAKDLIQFDDKYQECFATTALEGKMMDYIKQYDRQEFVEELIVKLVTKELQAADGYVTAGRRVLLEEKYENEIRSHGVDHLSICWEQQR